MRILLLHNYYRFHGGEETYFESLAALLKKNGHSVYSYTKDSAQISSAYSKTKTAAALFFSHERDDELRKIIEKFKPDIAHCNNLYPIITTTVYSLFSRYGIPIVQTIHNYRMFCAKGILFRNNQICEQCVLKQFPYPSILHSCYQSSFLGSVAVGTKMYIDSVQQQYDKVSHFIFPSAFTRDYHCDRLPFIKTKNTIIPYYVPDTLYSKKEDYFLYAGRLSEEKGILQLLQLVKDLPNLKLTVVGDGPLLKEVMDYARFPHITIHKRMNRKKLLSVIQRAKCVVIPSRWFEVLPYVYLESLASGTPTLTPNTPPFQRKIANEKCYYFTLNDFNDLKKQLIRLSDKPAAQSDQFYNEYQNNYTESEHYNKLISLYKSL